MVIDRGRNFGVEEDRLDGLECECSDVLCRLWMKCTVFFFFFFTNFIQMKIINNIQQQYNCTGLQVNENECAKWLKFHFMWSYIWF